MRGKIKVIGITGSIGMGKTTAADMLRGMRIPVHDSDASVHTLIGPNGGAVPLVGKEFPEAVKTDDKGAAYIDRQVLGRVIFTNADKKKILEDILHPIVRAESDRFVEKMAAQGKPIVALDIPLLFETGGETRVDAVVCVSAPESVQRARVLARPGMTLEKFERIVAGQLPDAEKRRRSDYVVETDKGFDSMRAQLKKIIDALRREND